MSNPMSKGALFDPHLVSDLIIKVQGTSALAELSAQTPIPFNGMKEMIFSMDQEIDIVAENGKKSHGGVTVEPVTIVPIKFEYGARLSDEFLYAAEEEQLSILEAFNDGFAKKVARGLDLAAFHGVNPRSGAVSAVVGDNCFDKAVTKTVAYTGAAPDDNLEEAVLEVQNAEGIVSGIAMAPAFGSAMASVKANNVRQYPEFAFGANPGTLNGMRVAVNNTVSGATSTDRAIVGDFSGAFRWGYAKRIPMEIIQYGDPDNSGVDLKGSNQIYIRAEVYLGWGILLPDSFVRIVESNG